MKTVKEMRGESRLKNTHSFCIARHMCPRRFSEGRADDDAL